MSNKKEPVFAAALAAADKKTEDGDRGPEATPNGDYTKALRAARMTLLGALPDAFATAIGAADPAHAPWLKHRMFSAMESLRLSIDQKWLKAYAPNLRSKLACENESGLGLGLHDGLDDADSTDVLFAWISLGRDFAGEAKAARDAMDKNNAPPAAAKTAALKIVKGALLGVFEEIMKERFDGKLGEISTPKLSALLLVGLAEDLCSG